MVSSLKKVNFCLQGRFSAGCGSDLANCKQNTCVPLRTGDSQKLRRETENLIWKWVESCLWLTAAPPCGTESQPPPCLVLSASHPEYQYLPVLCFLILVINKTCLRISFDRYIKANLNILTF